MTNHEFYQLPKSTRQSIFSITENQIGMPDFTIEKDWWVVETLRIIYQMEVSKHLVFKGGTSLSKAWKLIERFSEDIDLALDKAFFGFSNRLSKKEITQLRKETNNYLSTEFIGALSRQFILNGYNEIKLNLNEPQSSDEDPRIIELTYPITSTYKEYIRPIIQIEIGCRSLKEPFSLMPITSIVNELNSTISVSEKPIQIPTVRPERTLLEKLFLLHEEFQKPSEKSRVNRLSRHLYDIYKLSRSPFALNAIKDKELYQTIVEHRKLFTKISGVDYRLHHPNFLNPIPPKNTQKDWINDYTIMKRDMIYGNAPSFEEMIEEVNSLVNQIRANH